jgi:hypothetical protein
LAAAQKKARKRQEITTLAEFQTLLQNYQSFSKLNRQTAACGKMIWHN